MVLHTERIKANFNGTLNSLNYPANLFSSRDNDTLTFKQMIHQPAAKEFVQVMIQELDANESRNHWSIILKSNLLFGTIAILAIWSFKSKRYPDESIQKYKTIICAHGGM